MICCYYLQSALLIITVSVLNINAELVFPKCEQILREVNGKVPCHYCGTERVSSECMELCHAKGCITKSDTDTSKEENSKRNAESVESTKNNGRNENFPSCNNINPCVDLETANSRFYQCCKDKGLTDTCWKHCRYDISKKEAQDAFTHHECELSESRDYLYCAADNKDNGYCCTQKHVTDGARAICEPFCNPASKNWPTSAQAKYLKCLGQFDSIMKCHWAAKKP